MDTYFLKYRKGVPGIDTFFSVNDCKKRNMLYADWAAMGKNYLPVETKLQKHMMPLLSNTDCEANMSRAASTYAYNTAKQVIKNHINAGKDDSIITAYSGTTRMIKKFQELLGFHPLLVNEKTVVFVTAMEHYSNHKSWIEAGLTVEVIRLDINGLVDLAHLSELLEQYQQKSIKIASITACSNVTGIISPYHRIAQMMHEAGGYCFVDFSYAAPYVCIDMHPEEAGTHLDAVFFSPHKFLGGPGSAAVLVFNKKLYYLNDINNYDCKVLSVKEIENREDIGTPAILQTIKTAMCIGLKEEMGMSRIQQREHELLAILWKKLKAIPGLYILAPDHTERLGIISFVIEGLSAFTTVKLLNDKFGIQCKAGKSVPDTYEYKLIEAQRNKMKEECPDKTGWVRISIHPVMTVEEVQFIGESIAAVVHRDKKLSIDNGTDQQQLIPVEIKEEIEAMFTFKSEIELEPAFLSHL